MPRKKNSSFYDPEHSMLLFDSEDSESEEGPREFPPANSHIPEWIVTGAQTPDHKKVTADVIRDFKEKNKETLTDEDNEYLDGRIQGIEAFEKRKAAREDVIPTTRKAVVHEDGTVQLDHIHQARKQSTYNGCYSCATELLLQGRGYEMSQEEIRAFRPENGLHGDGRSAKEDRAADIMEYAKLTTAVMPNTGAVDIHIPINQYGKEKSAEAAWEVIEHAIKECNSPVAVLHEGHYRTIVGYNKEKNILIYKNSNSSQYPADYNHKITMDYFMNSDNINLAFLAEVKKDDPVGSFRYVPGLTMKDGKYADLNNYMVPVTDREYSMNDEFESDIDVEDGGREFAGSKFKFKNGVLADVIAQLPEAPVPEKSKQKEVEDKIWRNPLKEEIEAFRQKTNDMMKGILPFSPDAKLLIVPSGNNNLNVCSVLNGVESPGVEVSQYDMKRYLALQNLQKKADHLNPEFMKNFDDDALRMQATGKNNTTYGSMVTTAAVLGKRIGHTVKASELYERGNDNLRLLNLMKRFNATPMAELKEQFQQKMKDVSTAEKSVDKSEMETLLYCIDLRRNHLDAFPQRTLEELRDNLTKRIQCQICDNGTAGQDEINELKALTSEINRKKYGAAQEARKSDAARQKSAESKPAKDADTKTNEIPLVRKESRSLTN